MTRLESVSLADYAKRAGLSDWAAYKRRRKAEQRLVESIRDGELSDPQGEVVAEATRMSVADWEQPDHRHRPS